MAKTKSGRNEFKRRQKRLAARSEQAVKNQQSLLVSCSFVILIVAVALATINTWSADTKSLTDPAAWRLPNLKGGGNISLASFQGKPLVVTFYSSTNCPDCIEDLPGFVAADKSLAGKVNFVAVDTREDNKTAALKTAKDLGFGSWPIAHDVGSNHSEFHNKFKGSGAATTLFYDKNGNKLQEVNVPEPPDALQEHIQTYFQLDNQ